MARKLQKNQCWRNTRLVVGEGYIEVRESKKISTTMATFVMGLALLFGWLLILSLDKSFDFAGLFAGVFLTVLPIAWVLAAYRIPRGFRLYPDDQIALRFRTIYGVMLFKSWYDLQDQTLLCRKIQVYSQEPTDRKSRAGSALGCLFSLLGIWGSLLSAGIPKQRKEVCWPAYGVTTDQWKRPLAIFLSRLDAERAVAKYDSAKRGELEGYRRGPSRFEKRPGA